jgi:hypothetical protein
MGPFVLGPLETCSFVSWVLLWLASFVTGPTSTDMVTVLICWGWIQRKMVYGTPWRSWLYKLTLCPLQSRLHHIYHGHWLGIVMGNPMTEPTLTLCQSRLYPPVRDLGFGLCSLFLIEWLLKCHMKTTIFNRRWCAVGSILAVVEAEGAHLNPDDANQVRIQYFSVYHQDGKLCSKWSLFWNYWVSRKHQI